MRQVTSIAIRLLLCALPIALVQAQSKPEEKPVSPAVKAATDLSKLRDKPAEYVPALAKYLHDYPDTETAESVGIYFRTVLPKTPSPAVVRPLAQVIMPAIDQAPDTLRVRLYSDVAKTLLTHQLFAEALEMATKGIPLLDEKQYIEFERHRSDRQVAAVKLRNPDYKAREFNPAPYATRYTAFKAGYYSTQARALVGLGKLDEADAAYHTSYSVLRSTESAWGLGDVLERRGKIAEALPYYTEAVLTGKLKEPELEHFRQFYAKLNPTGAVERYLDTEYRKTYHNPIPEMKYEPVAGHTGRAVLVEFFTGGGCVPCVPFDYSFERILESYPRTDVVLLVNHWHAPVQDPLGNHSVDARVKYYEVRGAPTVFIDGKRFSSKDDNASESETKEVAPRVFDAVTKSLRSRMLVAPGATLTGKASLQGGVVRVSAGVSGLADKTKATLHVGLVEKEVSYSGENGLRFQPMVLRALAPRAQPGDYSFDLKKITEDNLRYYDEYPEERKAEITAEGRASILSMVDFNFREHKNVMDPANLAVVIFLQNDETKEILQSLYVPVDSGSRN